MRYLLDTNTCVQFLRYGIASPVGRKLAAVSPADVAICSVVLGELLFGALRSQTPARDRNKVEALRAAFHSLPFEDLAAEEYAKLRADLAAKGTPIGANDMLIAAIALANGLTLVTHNTGEFSRVVGLTLEDWQI